MSFTNYQLRNEVQRAISDLGFEKPSEIQEQVLDLLLERECDLVGQAQTGTGKTAAFVLPLLERIDLSNKNVQALILAPTRELANQVTEEINKLGKYLKIPSLTVCGGVSYDRQHRSLKKDFPRIVVGTPGRVIDLINRGWLKLETTPYLILDEADEMLNMGFFEDVQKVVSSFSEDRNIWMFSATMPKPILDLMKKEFHNPEVIQIKKKTLTNSDVLQRYYVVKKRYFNEALHRLLATIPEMYGIIFCRTRRETRELAEELLKEGYSVDALHGEMGQGERDAAMRRFKSQKSNLLVCTDVAARGIDVNNLTHVINYDFPQDYESYVHRIGRTGRAGMQGEAITIIDSRDQFKIKRLESFTKQKIERGKLPEVGDLKKSLVMKELNGIMPILEAVIERGDYFKLDETYKIFENAFECFSKEELLKIFFTSKFNHKIARLNSMGTLDDHPSDRRDRKSGPSRRGERRTDRRDRGDRGERGGKREKRTGAMAARVGNVRLFMNAGKMDQIQLKSLLQDLSKQTGLQQQKIQNVVIKERFSFFEIPEEYGVEVVRKNNLKINKSKVRVEYSS